MDRREMDWQEAARPIEAGMPVFPGDPEVKRHVVSEPGEAYRVSAFSMCVHSGTHLDAPCHVGLEGGAEGIPMERLFGEVEILDWRKAQTRPRGRRFGLILGGRGLTLEETRVLLENTPETLLVDGMSVGEGEDEWAVHHLLLQGGTAVIENAAIEEFSPGMYEMRAMPLYLPGSDGAPLRIQLRRKE